MDLNTAKERIIRALADAYTDIQDHIYNALADNEDKYYEIIDFVEQRIGDVEDEIEDTFSELEGGTDA